VFGFLGQRTHAEQTLYLVKAGKATATIVRRAEPQPVLGEDGKETPASRTNRRAIAQSSNDLQKHLQQITGVALKVVQDGGPVQA